MDQPIWLTFVVAFIFMNVLLVGMAYMTWYERKVLAAMQDRVGPNRSGPKGLLQPLADGIKLLGKEDLIPAHADKVVFYFAPLGVYGIILGGYASANRYSLLGGLRSAAQVVSYEIILGLSLMGIFLLSSSLSVRTIMEQQTRDLVFVLGG